jgi:CII-binding regulator of phage lambda lysogenization HflD
LFRLAKEEVKTGEPKRKQGGYLESAYPVSKAADIAYMKSLARAVKDRNINVYGVRKRHLSISLPTLHPTLTFNRSY